VVNIGRPAGGIGLPGGSDQDDGNMGILGRLGKGNGLRAPTGPGNSVDDGQAMDVIGEDPCAGNLGDIGVGDGSRSYTCDPNGGDGLRSYTCNPNDGDGSRRYICDPNDGARPGRYTSGRNNGTRPSGENYGRRDKRDGRLLPLVNRHPRSALWRDEQRSTGDGGAFDGTAIAGDPLSSTRCPNRPSRTTRLPVRYKDFRMT